jgi:hypothetical protein
LLKIAMCFFAQNFETAGQGVSELFHQEGQIEGGHSSIRGQKAGASGALTQTQEKIQKSRTPWRVSGI